MTAAFNVLPTIFSIFISFLVNFVLTCDSEIETVAAAVALIGSSGHSQPRPPISFEFGRLCWAEDDVSSCGSSLMPLREDVAAARSALQIFLLKKKIREKMIIFACLITASREREGIIHLVSQDERTSCLLTSLCTVRS